MPVKIRLKRLGRKKRPFYRVVAIDSRSRRDGAEIERLGWFDPLATNGEQVKLNEERLFYWLGQGAQPSNTVRNLMSRTGNALKWHLVQAGKDAKEIEAAMEEWHKGQEEGNKRLEALKVQKERESKKSKTKAAEEAPAEEAPAEEVAKAVADEETQTGDAPKEEPEVEAVADEAPAEDAADEDAPANDEDSDETPDDSAKKSTDEDG